MTQLGETDGEYYVTFPNTKQPGEYVYCRSDTYKVGIIGYQDWVRYYKYMYLDGTPPGD